jgi:hypothetical protein
MLVGVLYDEFTLSIEDIESEKGTNYNKFLKVNKTKIFILFF